MIVYLDESGIGKTITYTEENGKKQYLYVHDKDGFNIQPITEHDKQVRTGVVKEIKQKLVQLGRWDMKENGSIYFKMNINTLNDILDKFEQGE